MEWNHSRVISQLLAKPNINIFDELIREIELYFSRTVSNVQEMKDRDNKKKKGDIWELFCRDWLIASSEYLNVWLLKDFNTEFNLTFGKQDNGIDLIAQTSTGWIAIQCKYRSRGRNVDWKSLSTFIGLCERTGPWQSYLVMSNCVGISRKMPPTPKDRSICRGTFRNTTREHWLKMVGSYQPRVLAEPLKVEILQPDGSIIKTEWKKEAPRTQEELRAARLAKFCSTGS